MQAEAARLGGGVRVADAELPVSPVTSPLRAPAVQQAKRQAGGGAALARPGSGSIELQKARLLAQAKLLSPGAVATLKVLPAEAARPDTATAAVPKTAHQRRIAAQQAAVADAAAQQRSLQEKRQLAVEAAVNERRFDAALPPLIDRRATSARLVTADSVTPAHSEPEPEPEPEPEEPESQPEPTKPKGHWLWGFRKFSPPSVLTVNDIEDDLLIDILAFLPGRQLGRVGRTCRAWRQLMIDPLANELLWKSIQQRGARIPHSPAHLGRLYKDPVTGAQRPPTWRDAFVASTRIDDNWKAGRLEREVRHGHHGLVSNISMVGKLTITSSYDGTMRAFLPPTRTATSMVRGGEAGCVAIDTRADHMVPRGAKGKSILCMRTVGAVEPGGPYAGESVRAWCSSNDGLLQVWDVRARSSSLVGQWSAIGADVFRIDAASKRLYCASNSPGTGGQPGICVYQLPDSLLASGKMDGDGCPDAESGSVTLRRVGALGLPKMRRQGPRGLSRPAVRTHTEEMGGTGSTWTRPSSLGTAVRGIINGPTYGYGGLEHPGGGRLASIVAVASSKGAGLGGIGAVIPKPLAPLLLRRQLGTHGEGGDGIEDNLSKIDVLDLTHDERVRHHLFSAYGNGRIVGWDLEHGTVRCNWSPSRRRGGVRCVACDGELVYCGFSDGYLRVYDQRQWRCVKAERIHDDYINSIVIHREYDKLCTASDDGRVGIYGVDSNQFAPLSLGRLKGVWVGRPINSLDFNHSKLVAGCVNGSVMCYDFSTTQEMGPDGTMDIEALREMFYQMEAKRDLRTLASVSTGGAKVRRDSFWE